LTILQQAAGLKSLYPDGVNSIERNRLVWCGEIIPTPLSQTYKVKLVYERLGVPKLYVVEPQLILPKDRKWPHLYEKDRLCLYFPGEWKSRMSLATTIIPWASEWFAFYEIWLATGEWRGGGRHPAPSSRNRYNSRKEKRNGRVKST
jgi:hypothetical protein